MTAIVITLIICGSVFATFAVCFVCSYSGAIVNAWTSYWEWRKRNREDE